MGECVKRFIVFLLLVFCSAAHAETETINWYMDDNVYATTTCESGGDITLPTAPTKYGYTFQGWRLDYTPIEYLESTGTQYIDTGIQQSLYAADLVVKATFQYNVNTGEKWLMGVSASTYYMPLLVRAGYFQSNIGNGGTDIQTQTVDTNKHTMICDSVNKTITIDNTQYLYTSNSANISKNIYLFGLNNNGNAHGLSNLKLYEISFYTGYGDLIRDFIPVLDGAGIPCLYDKVERKFYYNSGTGDFIAGPVIGG